MALEVGGIEVCTWFSLSQSETASFTLFKGARASFIDFQIYCKYTSLQAISSVSSTSSIIRHNCPEVFLPNNANELDGWIAFALIFFNFRLLLGIIVLRCSFRTMLTNWMDTICISFISFLNSAWYSCGVHSDRRFYQLSYSGIVILRRSFGPMLKSTMLAFASVSSAFQARCL